MTHRPNRSHSLPVLTVLALAAGCSAPSAGSPGPEARLALASPTAPAVTAPAPPAPPVESFAEAAAPAPPAAASLALPAAAEPEPDPWLWYPEGPPPETPQYGSRQYRPERDGAPAHNATFMLGVRSLQNGDWSGVDEPADLSFTEDSRVIGKKFSVDFGVHYSASGSRQVNAGGGQTTGASSEVWEFDLGLLKRFAPGGGIWQPYVGGGLALVRAAGTTVNVPEPPRDHDWGFGGYLRAGLAVMVSYGGFVGINFHYLGLTNLNLNGQDTDVNGGVVSIFFGVGF